MNRIWNFIKEEDGLETVEYAVILGLILVGTITAVLALGAWVNGQFEELNTTLGAGAP